MTAILRHDETGVLYHESCVDVGDLASFSPGSLEANDNNECGECGEEIVQTEEESDPVALDDFDDLDERQIHRADGD